MLPEASIAIDDAIGGAWYALNGDSNGVAGDDLRVLVGQFTTNGDLSGQLYCQVFIEGDGANEFRDTFYFGAGGPVLGCTDATACNYDELATDDDGSCEFPLDLYGSIYVDCLGACLSDTDGDGICDEEEVLGCQNEEACNYNALATDDDGSCVLLTDDCDSCDGEGGITDGDTDDNDICDVDQIDGCTDQTACNYNPLANADDASCEFTSCAGCIDVNACNYDASATIDDGSCEFPAGYPNNIVDCGGNCLSDDDADGICNEEEVAGCEDETACNYNPAATDSDGSCTYPAEDYLDCDGACLNDADEDGICDELEVAGCTDEEACNTGDFSDTDNTLCTYPDGYPTNIVDCDGACINDTDGDGVCDEDEVGGCDDEMACNFSASATDNDGSCTYPIDLYGLDYVDCDGACLNDEDGDGVCDEEELAGCTDPNACNAGDFTDTNDDLCTYPDGYPSNIVNCEGECLNDIDGDGVCDEEEVGGCDDDTACNFSASATDNDGSCVYADSGYDCDGNCLVDTDGDGTCDPFEIEGCQDETACNYNSAATDAGPCEYPIDLFGADYVDCEGGCLNDLDDDDICNEDEALTVTGGAVEVALNDGAAIDSTVALLIDALESPSDFLIEGLILSGNGDLVVPSSLETDCGSLFLPVDAAWGEAGYNLNALSQGVLGDLLVGHIFVGLCELMTEGEVYLNYYGEEFTYTEAEGDARLVSASGEALHHPERCLSVQQQQLFVRHRQGHSSGERRSMLGLCQPGHRRRFGRLRSGVRGRFGGSYSRRSHGIWMQRPRA